MNKLIMHLAACLQRPSSNKGELRREEEFMPFGQTAVIAPFASKLTGLVAKEVFGASDGVVKFTKVATTASLGLAVGATTVDPVGATVAEIAAAFQLFDEDPSSPFHWLRADLIGHGLEDLGFS
jgi:hypothetical protein